MTQLYDYQLDYLNNLPKDIIMAADVGLGKGQMSLEHYKRHNAGGLLLIVAPASKVRTGDWQRELEMAGLPEAPVLSYERFTKDVAKYMDDELTVIWDECHFLCNATSKRGRAAIKLGMVCKQWIGLSATPLPNGWRSAETYAILTGLSKNKTAFVQRFQVIDRSRGFPILLGYRDQDVLDQWWNQIARPLKRTGAQHLPSQSIAMPLNMTPSLTRVYQKALKQRVYEDELLDNPSKLFTTLRQIPTPARIEGLHSILDSTDEHIVVFYNFNSEREAILELLNQSFKEREIYEQSGQASRLPSRESWAGLSPSVTLAQYQSASQAIELTYASVTVYFSPSASFANYEQSKGRTRRNGQGKTTLFYHFAVEGTLDHHIWQIIKTKRVFSEKLMRDILKDEGVSI